MPHQHPAAPPNTRRRSRRLMAILPLLCGPLLAGLLATPAQAASVPATAKVEISNKMLTTAGQNTTCGNLGLVSMQITGTLHNATSAEFTPQFSTTATLQQSTDDGKTWTASYSTTVNSTSAWLIAQVAGYRYRVVWNGGADSQSFPGTVATFDSATSNTLTWQCSDPIATATATLAQTVSPTACGDPASFTATVRGAAKTSTTLLTLPSIPKTGSMTLQQSLDDGQTWTTAATSTNQSDATFTTSPVASGEKYRLTWSGGADAASTPPYRWQFDAATSEPVTVTCAGPTIATLNAGSTQPGTTSGTSGTKGAKKGHRTIKVTPVHHTAHKATAKVKVTHPGAQVLLQIKTTINGKTVWKTTKTLPGKGGKITLRSHQTVRILVPADQSYSATKWTAKTGARFA